MPVLTLFWRDKYMESAIKNMGDAELLSIINPSLSVMIGEYSVPELLNVAEEEALAIKGIGEGKIKVLMALKEVVRRIMHRTKNSIKSVHSPSDAIEYFQYLASKPTEEVWVLLLDNKNHVIDSQLITKGTVCSSNVGMREIFAPAIKRMASSIIVAHNHPSGISFPSQEDIKITKKLIESSEILGIQVVDHIIIAKEGSQSLREARRDLFGRQLDI